MTHGRALRSFVWIEALMKLGFLRDFKKETDKETAKRLKALHASKGKGAAAAEGKRAA